MKKLAIALMIVVASAAYAAKEKSKSKDKSFEPVVKAAAQYAGSYRGPNEAYGLVLQAPNGRLGGNYVELGRIAVLYPIVLDGANFTANASFDDGSSRKITGTFSKRTLNGATAFGVRLYGVKVEGLGEVDTFFERLE